MVKDGERHSTDDNECSKGAVRMKLFRGYLRRYMADLIVYLKEKNLYTSFKAFLLGTAYLYGGFYIRLYAPAFGYYASMFQLIGLIAVGYGLYKVKYIKDFFKGEL